MNRGRVRSQLGELWRGRDVAVVYAVLVVVVSVVAATQAPSLLRGLVQSSSTNLVNLRQRPLSVLFASAFVIAPAVGLWIVVPMWWPTARSSGGSDA
jgi:hypothetical protein